MSQARDAMLAAVRRAVGREQPKARATVAADRAQRLPQSVPRPVWEEAALERFTARLEQAAGTWERLPRTEDIPAAAARFLEGVSRKRLRYAGHPLLQALTWPADWETAEGPADAADWPAAIGVAYAGIAETGSVVFPSGPERPTTLNFLPDHHLVVLPAADIVDYMESVWERLLADGGMPRTLNVITGPSRTADVEQTIQLGAHGPRRLHVLLLEST